MFWMVKQALTFANAPVKKQASACPKYTAIQA
jgi:hypothetical protein